MIYLLDVNALVALGFLNHEFHDRVAVWVQSRAPQLASCSITELGFVRILTQAPAYGLGIAQARTLLLRLKRASGFTFIANSQDIAQLPVWVKSPRQITDGHLHQLADANGAALATLDENIPGSFLIPR